jgi:predicted DCC family thiol-disulfide oxidoreductase YuxK
MVPSGAADLYYDSQCGPCTFFARVSERAAGSRLRARPLDSPEAVRELSDLDEETRWGYAHLVMGARRSSGAAIMTPLVGLTLGARAERVVVRLVPLSAGLRRTYSWFWNYRRSRGCAASAGADASRMREPPASPANGE